MAFLLQSTCPANGLGAVSDAEKFHEIGDFISRLLGSVISRVKSRAIFDDAIEAIQHLLAGGSNSFGESNPSGTYMWL